MLVFQPQKAPVRYEISLQQESTFFGMEQVLNGRGVATVSPGEASSDGNANLIVELSNVEVTVKQGEELQELDLGLNGKKVDVTVSPRGEVVSLKPTTPLEGMTEDALKSLVRALFPYLPEGQVKEGATWVEKRVEPSDDKSIKEPEIDGAFEYTLEEFGNKDGVDTAKVFGEGKVKIHKATPGGVFVGDAKGESEVHVGVKDGWIVHNTADMTVNGTVGDTEITRVERFECKRLAK
jgi:hypothetical protein